MTDERLRPIDPKTYAHMLISPAGTTLGAEILESEEYDLETLTESISPGLTALAPVFRIPEDKLAEQGVVSINMREPSINRRIKDRLEELFMASYEEGPDQQAMSLESLRWFIYFFQHREYAWDCPSLYLTYSGNIRAVWEKGRDKRIAVQFLPDGQGRYVVFAPNAQNPSDVDRNVGTTALESLIEKLEEFGVLDWLLVKEGYVSRTWFKESSPSTSVEDCLVRGGSVAA